MYAHADLRDGIAWALAEMLKPRHKPKLPMAKAAFFGAASASEAASAAPLVLAMPLTSSTPGPLAFLFLLLADFDFDFGLLSFFTSSGPKFGTLH